MNFAQCKASNQASDNDNLFDAAGQFWWDLRC